MFLIIKMCTLKHESSKNYIKSFQEVVGHIIPLQVLQIYVVTFIEKLLVGNLEGITLVFG